MGELVVPKTVVTRVPRVTEEQIELMREVSGRVSELLADFRGSLSLSVEIRPATADDVGLVSFTAKALAGYRSKGAPLRMEDL